MAQRSQILWQSESTSFSGVTDDLQYFTAANTVVVDNTNIPDATHKVWHEIHMQSWEYLRIYGEIVTVDIGSYTASKVGLFPMSFYRPPLSKLAALANATDPFIGADATETTADVQTPNARLNNFAIQRTTETTDILQTGGFDHTDIIARLDPDEDGILPGVLVTDAQPIARSTGLANGQVSRWWYDIGQFGVVGLTAPNYTEIVEPGEPLASCAGLPRVYVCIRAINTAAWAGTPGTGFLIGGQITAVLSRVGGSQ